MNEVITAIVSVSVIGLALAAMLTIASKLMAVEVDERIPAIRALLPGANCGACGYPGCDGYAEALNNGGVKPNLCTPGGDTVATAVSGLLGLDFEDVVEQVAVVQCRGNYSATHDKMDYQGIDTCAAASLLFSGRSACAFGCLGLGDCFRACPSEAICLENGVARILSHKCTGCGLCVRSCPKALIELIPDTATVAVACKSTQKGAIVRKLCTNGCIACLRCEKECPEGAIKVENNLARIDYEKCTGCGRCAKVCPTGCIVYGDFSGVHHIAAQ